MSVSNEVTRVGAKYYRRQLGGQAQVPERRGYVEGSRPTCTPVVELTNQVRTVPVRRGGEGDLSRKIPVMLARDAGPEIDNHHHGVSFRVRVRSTRVAKKYYRRKARGQAKGSSGWLRDLNRTEPLAGNLRFRCERIRRCNRDREWRHDSQDHRGSEWVSAADKESSTPWSTALRLRGRSNARRKNRSEASGGQAEVPKSQARGPTKRELHATNYRHVRNIAD